MSFDSDYAFVLQLEIGIHLPSLSDPNPTKDGVTQKTYNKFFESDVRGMTEVQRAAIYRSFWLDSKATLLPTPISSIHFAAFFNMDPITANKCLQSALGMTTIDGIIGPKTQEAMKSVGNIGSIYSIVDLHIVRQALLNEHMIHYYNLALHNQNFRPNLVSWIGRLVAGAKLVSA